MDVRGQVRNGVVVLEEGSTLPEGAAVAVVYPAPSPKSQSPACKRIRFPLVHSAQPGSINLTNEHVAEILDEEDAASRH